MPEVWPRQNPDPAAMADQFAEELTAVQGEVIRCATMSDARRQLAELVKAAGWTSIGAMDRPIGCEAVDELDPGNAPMAQAELAAHGMAELSASWSRPSASGRHRLVPDRLPHGRGPAAVLSAAGVRGDRPGRSIGRASAGGLGDDRPALADRELRGEFVIVTGPSRTADIEKILILGVHGPKRLVVLLVG